MLRASAPNCGSMLGFAGSGEDIVESIANSLHKHYMLEVIIAADGRTRKHKGACSSGTG
jgi:hypothetical protein